MVELNIVDSVGRECVRNALNKMKISKRQLRQIIKEEKAKLQEQPSMMSSRSREALDSMQYNFEKAINSQLSLEDRFW